MERGWVRWPWRSLPSAGGGRIPAACSCGLEARPARRLGPGRQAERWAIRPCARWSRCANRPVGGAETPTPRAGRRRLAALFFLLPPRPGPRPPGPRPACIWRAAFMRGVGGGRPSRLRAPPPPETPREGAPVKAGRARRPSPEDGGEGPSESEDEPSLSPARATIAVRRGSVGAWRAGAAARAGGRAGSERRRCMGRKAKMRGEEKRERGGLTLSFFAQPTTHVAPVPQGLSALHTHTRPDLEPEHAQAREQSRERLTSLSLD